MRRSQRARLSTKGLSTNVLVVGLAVVAATGLLSVAVVLLLESVPAWRSHGFGFVTGSTWAARDHVFGAAAMLFGSLAVATIALALAGPLALATAVFASEWLHPRGRLAVKATVELLAGVPSVVWGLLGLLVLRDLVFRGLAPFDPLSGDTLVTAGVLLAGMVLPTIATLADDALQAVPRRQREAARALGLTRTEVVARVVLPQALPGLVAANLLGLGRALGETVAVYLVVGRLDGQLPHAASDWRLLVDAGQTITSKLGSAELAVGWSDPGHRAALLALGVLLLATTSVVSAAGLVLSRRGQQHA